MICIETVKGYCQGDVSQIENYAAAIESSETWDCHHRLEIGKNGALKSIKELKAENLYYLRPPSELIFLPHEEHCRMHATSNPIKTRKPYNKGFHYYNNGETEVQAKECPEGFAKGRLPRNAEWSAKISEARKRNPTPLTEELRKILSESHLGNRQSEEAKRKLKEAFSGRSWWNNGVVNKFQKERPEGFTKGKLPHKKDSMAW